MFATQGNLGTKPGLWATPAFFLPPVALCAVLRCQPCVTRLVASLIAVVSLAGCQCGEADLIRTYEDPRLTDAGRVTVDAGSVVIVSMPRDAGPVVMPKDGGPVTGATWCASDCDCPASERCISLGGELSGNTCQPGPSSCLNVCTPTCPSGQQCVNGACEVPPCVGTSCTSTFDTSVQGKYFTYYELDVAEFAKSAGNVLALLDLLNALLNGQGASCASQSTTQGRLMCFVVTLIGQNIHAPPWVGQLITVLSDAFRFGNKPVRIKGTMQLAEGQNSSLYAAEAWSEMWLEYNGQTLNVMASPQLGQAGQVTVTVPAFKGTRTATEVLLGPRAVEFDVNKLIVNMLNVVISAASNNQAHDVGELVNLLLCSRLPLSTGLLCSAAANDFARDFELNSGLGGAKFTLQRATIHDLDANHIADALGLPNNRGTVQGQMSNGFVSGALGSFPASNWYGTK